METLVYKRPESLLEDARFTFCPGCGHGVVLKIMAELIDEFKIKTDTIAIASVGCSVFLEKFGVPVRLKLWRIVIMTFVKIIAKVKKD